MTGPRPGESIGRLQPITGEDVTFCMAAQDAVIRVYDDAGNVIETHEHMGHFKE